MYTLVQRLITMYKIIRLFLLIAISILPLLSNSQDLKIGQWKSHLPYQFGRYITQSPTEVFYTTDWSVVSINKDDMSVEFYSTVNQLSETQTEFVKYVPNTGSLIIVYSDNTFDVITEEGTRKFSNLRIDGNFFSRKINDLMIASNGKVYFSMAFGLVEFDPEKEEFGFTTNLEINTTDIEVDENYIYATTEEGIYRAPNAPNINLKDLTNWTQLELFYQNTLYVADTTSNIQSFNNQLYVGINDTLFTLEDDQLKYLYHDTLFRINFMTSEGDNLLVGFRCRKNCRGRILAIDKAGNIRTANGSRCIDLPLYAIEDESGRMWYADSWRAYRTGDGIGAPCEKIIYNSPNEQLAFSVTLDDDDNVYLTTSPILSILNENVLRTEGLYTLIDGEWNTQNRRTNQTLSANDLFAFYCTAIHPDNGKVYVGSIWKGMAEFDLENEETKVYNNTNSPLDISMSDPNVTRVTGLVFDQNNNLWASNHNANRPVAVLVNETQQWKNDFPQVPSGLLIRQVTVDQFNNKWFAIDGISGSGILVLNEGDIDNLNDDQVRLISTSNSNLPNNQVNTIEVDLDGAVWVGTSAGTIVFECGSDPFNDEVCRGFRPIVEVDGFNAFLLEDESVRTIGVDGANRKWFGTESGIFVQSPDGQDQIAFLNKDNSPLFGNTIHDIAISLKTGEAFIGTNKGLISVKTETLGGESFHSPNIYAYPNPVRPDYSGPIAIKGLARDSNVKITDISGQLVYETTALGGQAIWDGRDYNGRKAQSGVYLVYATTSGSLDNPDAIVTKILFMN